MVSKSSSGGDPSRTETLVRTKFPRKRSLWEWGPSVLLSFHVLLVSRFPTGLVRFLCIAFPTCIRTCQCLSFASFCRFLLAYCLFVWLRRLWVHAVFKCMTKFTLNYAKAPCSHRGAEGRWRCLRPLVASFGGTDTFPWSLCSDSTMNSWPQPLESVGDDTLCEDTREDVGLSV